jgi:AmmeMemoRadiSam system protein B
MVRPPAVAGSFYTASPAALREEVARYCVPEGPPRPTLAVLSPHAGLKYSGPVAGAVYARLTPPQTVILVGPNHSGLGPAISVYPEGAWQMPGGDVPVDDRLARDLLDRCPAAKSDTLAHRFEHCLEVQLPFLQYLAAAGGAAGEGAGTAPSLQIVPVVLGTTRREICQELGYCLAELIVERGKSETGRPLLVVTTDMTHYESDDVIRRKDRFAIEAIRRGDPEGLEREVHARGITMCGLGPTLTLLHAAPRLGATAISLARYATSAEVSGDYQRVVGYAGFVIT